MQFLQRALDDPDPQPVRPLLGLHRRAAGPGRPARRRDGRRRPAVLPRPGRGRRAAQAVGRAGCPTARARSRFLAEGRALAFADDPAWTAELAELWRQDGPAPPEILDGMVEVLKRWSKTWQRPVAVVAMPSRRFPHLVSSVAEHIATVGRLPLVDALAVTGPPPERGQRLGRPGHRPALPHRRCSPGVRLRRAGAAGRRHHPHPLDDHRRRRPAGRRRRDPGAAAGHPPAP